MLQPAHVGHLAMLRSLIRMSAAEGCFDRHLALDTPEAVEFFAKLKRALVTGYFIEQDPRTRKIDTVPVPGYVFWPEGRQSTMTPSGFGLFRGLEEGGYELWLASLDINDRGTGNGRALLAALFATPPGQKTWVVRIQRESRYVDAVRHLLENFGFADIGAMTRMRWFVREGAPPALVSRIEGALQADSRSA